MADESQALTVQGAPPSLLNIIADASRDPTVDVTKLEALLKLQREVVAEDARIQFAKALKAAQGEIPEVAKNGTISLGAGKGQIPFATYEDMSRILKPIMDKHGLAISFDMTPRESGGFVITGTLEHEAGHSRVASIPLPLDTGPGRNNLQAMGSTLSYGRRYLCEMFFNIVRKGADDDGQLGGTRFISDEQRGKIEDLLKETGADEGKFLWFLGALGLDQIHEAQYTAAINSLLQRKAAMNKNRNQET